MNDIASVLTPHALVMFNVSFAATNEREGSEIARQIVSALMEKKLPHGNPTPEKTAAVVSNANYCSVYKAASI